MDLVEVHVIRPKALQTFVDRFRLTNHMACGLGFDGWLFPGEPRRRR
jgi:hypothetical protein